MMPARSTSGVASVVLLGCSLGVGCAKPPLDRTSAAYQAVRASSAVDRDLFDGRVRVTSLYKAQILTAYRYRELPPKERIPHFVASVYQPHTDFWSGYLGDEAAFTGWMERQITDLADPRVDIPLELEFDGLLETTINGMGRSDGTGNFAWQTFRWIPPRWPY